MKKIIFTALAGMIVCSTVSAQSIKIVNSFGGDSDATGGSDLFVFENQKDDDSYKNEFKNSTRASNRLQMDASDDKFDGRVRIETATSQLNGKESSTRLRGYLRFKPLSQFQVIAGNDFSTKVAVNAGYLAASDDYVSAAKILQNGFGAISNWAFGDDKNITLNVAGGLKGTDDSLNDKNKLGLDFGANFGVKNLFAVGGSVQNVAGNNLSAGVFAGLNAVKNLTLNAGYVFNNTDSSYIAKSAKNSLVFTAGYKFADIGLSVAGDVTSGLGSDYIKNGETLSYKNGDKNLIPFLTKVKVSYKVSDDVSVAASAKVSLMLGDNDSVKTEIYPNATYNLPNKMGSLSSGVRMSLDSKGISKISVPVCWKCTLAEIKK